MSTLRSLAIRPVHTDRKKTEMYAGSVSYLGIRAKNAQP
jgi:hypothetical protein